MVSNAPSSKRNAMRSCVSFTAVATVVMQVIVSLSLTASTTSDGYDLSFEAPLDNSNCIKHNSQEWLTGSRFQNLNESLPDFFIKRMTQFAPKKISDFWPLLEQTLAHKSSLFLKHDDSFDGNLAATIRPWRIRLMYLAIMYYQHKPAMKEARTRHLKESQENQCQSILNQYKVGRFDFECPDTSFVVGGLTNNGIGSNIRAATTTLLMAALTSNRTAVLIQNGIEGPKFIKKNWKLASCERKDFQCFFLPISPCVPSWQDIKGAHVLEDKFEHYFGSGDIRNIPADQMKNKVWILQKYGVQSNPPPVVSERLHRHARALVKSMAGPQQRVVMEDILNASNFNFTGNHTGFEYPGARNTLNHALEIYAMRPNFDSQNSLANILDDIVPSGLDASSFVGLPIRDSDKCYRESECLPFEDYIKAVDIVWRRLNRKSHPVILFTSESQRIVQAQRNFSLNSSYRFLVNSHDVIPNSGLISEVVSEGRFTADESMMSAISSFSFQLFARASILNCCSNFHMLLNDFLSEGLGSLFQENSSRCMQDIVDPELQICCGWEKEECKKRKATAMQLFL